MTLTITHSVQKVVNSKSTRSVPQDTTRVVKPIVNPMPLDTSTKPSVKKGIATTLEGAGAGALGGVAASTLPAWLSHAAKTGAQKGSFSLVRAGASFGAATSVSILSGAVTANMTTDKGEGAMIGAGIGAVAGAAILGPALGLGLRGIAIGSATGVLMGAIGGFAGAIAAEER